MKHITFDQSTVMSEFLRIASEQGLVKTAAEAPVPETRGGVAQPTQQTSMQPGQIETKPGHEFDNQVRNFASLQSLGGANMNYGALLNDLASPAFKRFAQGWYSSNDVAGRQKIVALAKQVIPYLRQLGAQLRKMPQNYQAAYFPKVKAAYAALKSPGVGSASDDGMEVEAALKLAAVEPQIYDVSGETGEQLVEKAHPGGGTKTELTHSKTEDNLVETIVEQQEKDIEVAHSVPKGTYAELRGLYNALSKMGYSEHLDGLRDIMAITGSSEEVLLDTLMSLADGLDKLGYIKYADQVDGLLKKKVAAPGDVQPVAAESAAEQFKRMIAKSIQNTSGNRIWNSVTKPALLRKWEATNMPTLTSAYDSVKRIIWPLRQTANTTGVDILGAIGDTYNAFSEGVRQEQAQQAKKQPSAPAPATPESEVAGTKVDTKKQQRMWNAQNKLRQMVGLKPKSQNPFDRELATVLRTKYPLAWQVVKKHGTLAHVIEALQTLPAPAPYSEQHTAPAAPPPPPAPGGYAPGELSPPAMPRVEMSAPAPTTPRAQPMTYQEQQARTNKELAEKRRQLRQTVYGPQTGRGPVRTW